LSSYAGITRIRFKGYDLRLLTTPVSINVIAYLYPSQWKDLAVENEAFSFDDSVSNGVARIN
jgi:hypothetical protein